ncbi:MAG TPA: GDP-mannose 4,6-dehydratase [Candidatus Baltobacteraceae bacterium]|nr:GDP-mannose 4,6-dehydratase [Candidatus Baltobacteraceae bacterium]
MRALVTGASGFVGRYLAEHLRAQAYDVIAAGGPHDAATHLPIDLADLESLDAAFDIAQPDVVFHLAAQAFVPRAIEAPQETYQTNVIGTANVLAALRAWRERSKQNVRLLFVSSAEVYGVQPQEAMPLDETSTPNPANPYAASKAAAEALVLGEVRAFGVDAVITRAFNHIGPGQNERFAVPAFAAQLAAIASGSEPVLVVGNLDARRDFLDVRDVVDAYVALARGGKSGEIYNVSSGSATSIREVLAELIRIAHVPVEVRQDSSRMRPSDVPLLYGCNDKLRAATGWSPRVPLRRTLQDVYNSFDKLETPSTNSGSFDTSG